MIQMDTDFITVAQFQIVHDAGLIVLQEKLDEAGIQYLVFNENMGSVAPFGAWAAGYVELRAEAERAEEAAGIWEDVQGLLDYQDHEEPELAGMREEEEKRRQRYWNALLYSVVFVGTAFWILSIIMKGRS